jgi:hypothetical protein
MPLPTPFSASSTGETQRNTELALYLLRLIEQQRDPHERIWPGTRALLTLQVACQVLEALHELNLKGLTHHLVEPAANWLLALPLALPEEDLRAFHLFPTRFKVLAQLGKFDPARLKGDFDAFCGLCDPVTGWMHDAPFDVHPTLVTMIWLDTLGDLEAAGLMPPEQRENRERALAALSAAFAAWVLVASPPDSTAAAADEPRRAGTFANFADASYAYYLLGRFGQFAQGSPLADEARQLLLSLLRDRPPGALRRTEPLYCAFHLLTRHPHHPETRTVVQSFLADTAERYASGDAQHEPLSFHALRLRLLTAYHGETLRTGLLEKLWQDGLATAEAAQRQQQEAMEAEFVDLIRQSIRVQLSPPQRITGTRARGEVYRVRFGLTTESTDERGAPLSTPRDTLRLIVKKGPPHVLLRAIERYHGLPEQLQTLFARHTDLPDGLASGYLIMQDLAEMQPLSEVLNQLDRPVIMAEERARTAAEVAEAVSGIMQGLHGFERRPSLVAHQLDVIYLAPMAAALERLAQPMAFPELEHWLHEPLAVNGRAFQPLSHYLGLLHRQSPRLNPPSLGLVHGDCHSRNIMLSHDLSEARFVDIETLSSAQDYLVDYGLLLEDSALYQSLPYGEERGRVTWDEVAAGDSEPDLAGPAHWINYPAFPHSEAVIGFQQELLQHLRAFAEDQGDEHWQPRLWLAIARGLLLLASRQLSSHTVPPQRRTSGPRYVNDTRLVQVAYAEALRLLHDMAAHLDPGNPVPLPPIPFPGEVRPGDESSGSITALLHALGDALGESADRRPVPGLAQLTDFITRPGEKLFARVHALDSAPVIYLAGQPDNYLDAQHLLERPGTDDAALVPPGLGARLPARVAAADTGALGHVMDLVRQARELAGHSA